MLGFGMSAISQLDSLYVQNHVRITDWEDAVRQGASAVARGYRLSDDDRLRRDIINRLMCTQAVDIPLIESRVGDFDRVFPGVSDALSAMAEDGLLTRQGRRWVATRLGRFLLRNIAMLFDAHLPSSPRSRFSRTI
jgi:oxygen-independent coproporphyrinogen-3 oxidase